MKSKHLWLVLVLAIAFLGASTCFKKSDNGTDDADDPNFVQETCSGCVTDEQIKSGSTVTGYRFYSYVKNSGGTGKIGMTISAGSGSASKEFAVIAGTSYVFTATVTVQAKSSASFTYMAKFPGTAGYTDTHSVSGYTCTGAPYDLQLNAK